MQWKAWHPLFTLPRDTPNVGVEERDVRRETVDVVHYVLGLQNDLNFDLGSPRRSYLRFPNRFSTPSELTLPLRREWNQVFVSWKRNETRDLSLSLELLLVATQQLRSNVLGPDDDSYSQLLADSQEKLDSMKNRPPLHGGRQFT